MKTCERPARFAMIVICCAVAFYVAMFVYHFDIFGAPVRSSNGWLGPLVRGDTNAEDIGKIWYTDRPNDRCYLVYWPLCRLWLTINGL